MRTTINTEASNLVRSTIHLSEVKAGMTVEYNGALFTISKNNLPNKGAFIALGTLNINLFY